jgi:hypothetical protein
MQEGKRRSDMARWEYTISTHPAADIRNAARVAVPTDGAPVLFCDSGGRCFFDEAPNPYVTAVTGILNERGAQGWILVQAILRREDMICFWRREVPE